MIHIARSRPRSIAPKDQEPVKEPPGSVTDLEQVVGAIWPLVQSSSVGSQRCAGLYVCVSGGGDITPWPSKGWPF